MHQATEDLLRDVLPWRTFRWYYGQHHYSGSYWASTTSAHVIYESRLELARLLMADFDTSVNHIVAQPFMMQTPIGGKIGRHIPDYLLLTDDGPVVVDVKPADFSTIRRWPRRSNGCVPLWNLLAGLSKSRVSSLAC
jgi:hypothetical protein